MKIREKLQKLDWDNEVERLVALGYLAGREAAAREICDIHNERLAKMRDAAQSCRYYHMANAIINAGQGAGNEDDTIYSPDYAGDVTEELCADEWPIKEGRIS